MALIRQSEAATASNKQSAISLEAKTRAVAARGRKASQARQAI